MNEIQKHVDSYMEEVILDMEDIHLKEAWYAIRDFLMDALSDSEEDSV